ncbi:MAG: T9SS type A sorting domain-containing protein, partial [candidate division KSB1 bacterium]|nr:T9SS type A sorting domain-containing protein [candidate division KSB1 bacterium]
QYGNQPCDFSVGWQTGEAYSYGGNDDVSTFLDRIARGDGAGSHLTHYNAAGGTPWWATGIDCSAFVSRCWEISRQSTRTLPNFSTEIARTDLLSGDILNKPASHVRLFDKRAADGRPIVYEASGSATKCVYRAVDWGDYTPLRFNELMIPAPQFRVENPGNRQIKISWNAVNHATHYQIYFSTDGTTFSDMGETTELSRTFSDLSEGKIYYFQVIGTNDQGELGIMSEVLAARVSAQPSSVLVVNGFDRMSTGSNTKNYVVPYAKALAKLGLNFDSCSNEVVAQNQINLKNYAIVIWLLGEESTANQTFSSQEQTVVRSYLENGGNLFVSGAEIGWDLDYYNNGRSFYQNYLKAKYVTDDANVYQCSGVPGTIFEGLAGITFDDGNHGTYNVDYPDGMEAMGGSRVCLNYDGTSYHAAIQYEGIFGASSRPGKLVHLGFPFETIYPESDRDRVMERVINFFGRRTAAANSEQPAQIHFTLCQNYPNPFNSVTVISYQLPASCRVELGIFNLLGEKVRTLIDDIQTEGWHQLSWDGTNNRGEALASGVYLYQLRIENHLEMRRMMLLK